MGDVWRTRLLWAAIGSVSTWAALRVFSPGAPQDTVTNATPQALPQAAPTSAKASITPVPSGRHDSAVAAVVETPSVNAPPDTAPVVIAPPVDTAPDTNTAPADAADAAPSDDVPDSEPGAAPPGDAPEYPLPRMPGMRTLRRSGRFDPELSRWVLMRASRVPAPASAVESFYTKALRDEGLTVARVDEPPDAAGTRRITLRARNASAKAQIAIRQPAGELVTTTRVIWQADAK